MNKTTSPATANRKRVGALLGAVLVLAISVSLLLRHTLPTLSPTRPYTFWGTELQHRLPLLGVNPSVIWSARRNKFGDSIYLTDGGIGSNDYSLILVRSGRAKAVPCPSARAYVGRDNTIVAWITRSGNELQFADGASIALPSLASIAVDPDARYFLVSEPPSRTWIGRITQPADRQLISSDLHGSSIFSRGRRVFVCGSTLINGNSGAACLVLKDDGQAFSVQEQHHLDWASGVMDLDPYEDRLLVVGKGEFSPNLYVYNLRTRLKSHVGTAKQFGFFLSTDPFTETQ